MADVFISYSREDRAVTHDVASLLEAQGVSVWWDRNIPIGRTFDDEIERQLQQARAVVVLWTARSVQSEWVKSEAMEGLEAGKLIPALIADARIPLVFRRTQAADLRGWPGEHNSEELEKFVDAVLASLGRQGQRRVATTVPAREQAPGQSNAERRGASSDSKARQSSAQKSAAVPPARIVEEFFGARQHALVAVHLAPDIPAKKLGNARASCSMPKGERAVALVDCTLFGTAKDAWVFGEQALYYHNVNQKHRIKYPTLTGALAKAEGSAIRIEGLAELSLFGAADDGYLTKLLLELFGHLGCKTTT
jgi:hypothetical protein